MARITTRIVLVMECADKDVADSMKGLSAEIARLALNAKAHGGSLVVESAQQIDPPPSPE